MKACLWTCYINLMTNFHEYLVLGEANPHPHLIVYSHEWHHRHSDPIRMNKDYFKWNGRIYWKGLFGTRFCRCKNWKKSWQPSEFGMHCCNSAYQILSCKDDSHILEVNLKQNACPPLKKKRTDHEVSVHILTMVIPIQAVLTCDCSAGCS